ncbi:MAG: nucleotide pyrophosphohydrolase [Deltaproteobacteria bacterium]|nr:nucleotide pyrophosphohydrolase [Deltaproteobacteria bacterium]
MKNLLKIVREFNRERDWEQYHSPKNLAMALLVEAAELAEIFQWLNQKESFQIAENKREAIKDEIGDVLIYLVNLADKCGIDPLKAAHDKIEKNRTKYPAEKVKGKHSKYNEYDQG